MSLLKRFTLSPIASDLRFAIRITNRNRNQIAPAILGLELAAPTLWAPGIFWLFPQEKTSMPTKFLVFWGGVFCFFVRGGTANYIFMARGFFLRCFPAFRQGWMFGSPNRHVSCCAFSQISPGLILGVPATPDHDTSAQAPDPNGSSIAIQMGGVQTPSNQDDSLRACFSKNVAVELGRVPRDFSTIPRSGFDVPLLIVFTTCHSL